ncbi:glycosyltransferase family 2 protein [Ureibacillus aquaedulcis]|uniref:Glycosyltransferase family 2 protein n=1 Tax=Ureibacillus aquaedulcis TaxID=3058421 RepID=A0ABT8GUQ7_9BACL|nr:glycosyltransferase family 2 protein [Ureibacillus sp. BA0131]MDN4495138.1 glycosyltransferase family 2 protein [Ureibacillus sp. BA0131]
MKISFIVPAYNAEKTISRCLSSILNQTYKNIEIIVIDDGSIDSTYDICQSFSKEDRRIKLLTQNNLGASSARNKGIEIATGEYVQFVDADDYINVKTVEVLVENLNKRFVDIIFFGFKLVKDSGVFKEHLLINRLYKDPKEAMVYLIRQNMFGFTCNKLIRRSILTENEVKFRTDISLFEDQFFYFECFKYISSVETVSDTLYHYCLNDSSLSLKYRADRFAMCEMMFKYMSNYFTSYNLSPTDSKNLLEQYCKRSIKNCLYELAVSQSNTILQAHNIVDGWTKSIIWDTAKRSKQNSSYSEVIFLFLIKHFPKLIYLIYKIRY